MVRPSDWYLVDLDGDPTPGDAFGIRQVAQKYTEIAYVAANAASLVRSMRSSGSTSAWVGDAGDVFRSETDRMPGELSKADDSYSAVADALSAWANALDDAQAQADRGLALARDAHADLVSAQAAYDHAHSSWSVAHAQQLSQQKLQKQYQDVPPPSGVSVPTDGQLRATYRNVAQARAGMDAATASIASATARLDAARRLVLEAKASRDQAEAVAVRQIGAAKDQAVKPSSVWEGIQDSAAWQAIVQIATVVLTIVSIVAIFVGGPIVWAIIAAATILLLVNSLLSIAQGKNAWGELAMLAVGLIPGGRLLALGATAGRAAIAAVGVARVAERVAPIAERVVPTVSRVAADAGRVEDPAEELPTLLIKLKRGWSPEQVDAMIQKIGQVNDRNPVVTSVDQEARNPNPRRLYEALFGKGSAAGQDVDHILDLRLGGQNTPENLQLLDPSVNRSFGAQISNEIRRLGLGEGTEVSVSLVR